MGRWQAEQNMPGTVGVLGGDGAASLRGSFTSGKEMTGTATGLAVSSSANTDIVGSVAVAFWSSSGTSIAINGKSGYPLAGGRGNGDFTRVMETSVLLSPAASEKEIDGMRGIVLSPGESRDVAGRCVTVSGPIVVLVPPWTEGICVGLVGEPIADDSSRSTNGMTAHCCIPFTIVACATALLSPTLPTSCFPTSDIPITPPLKTLLSGTTLPFSFLPTPGGGGNGRPLTLPDVVDTNLGECCDGCADVYRSRDLMLLTVEERSRKP